MFNKLNEELSRIRVVMGLNENRIYITADDVPVDIMSWARGVLRSNFTKNIVIRQEKQVEINMPWHEADRTYYQFFKLIDPKTAKMVGNEIGRSGLEGDGVVTGNETQGKLNVPSGYVLACAGTYPVRLELYTADDAMKPITEPNLMDQFSIDELVILLQAKGLKSPYRTKFPDDKYRRLIDTGYMMPNKSITVKGRNIASLPEAREKLDKYAEENGLFFSTGSYTFNKKY